MAKSDTSPGKANVVADALSRQPGMLARMQVKQMEMLDCLMNYDVQRYVHGKRMILAHLQVQPEMINEIKRCQTNDSFLVKITGELDKESRSDFQISPDGALRFRNRLCVPDNKELKEKILKEAHRSRYTIHPGANKMHQDLKKTFWWRNMKRDITTYVKKCLICQQVKAERKQPSGLLQPMPFPGWKWEDIAMDFVTGLPRTPRKHDAIWVIVDG
ncbi:hypothetical protein Nepgr_031227 [Nepenthes gracilis]|uniref:Integrase zinc-binding domain-containing protein n=1 Tax=Nepenthes gracilis TaxID=150966 RepID=A0AAD3Y6V2_NEPGR|nr:hypothetical protein Nepgr_031227 [Nepenthes gracilis]